MRSEIENLSWVSREVLNFPHPIQFDAITMPAKVKNLQKNDSRPITLWLIQMKGPSPHQEEELAKAIQKKIERKNMTGGKPAKNAISKKSCICSPTNHTGSFRCHLHRISSVVAQNSSWPGEDGSTNLQSKANFNAKNGHRDAVDKRARLSRLGTAASARTCHENPQWRPEHVK